MKTTLDRYPGYTFIDGKVISPKGREIQLTIKGYRVVNDVGVRTSVSKESLNRQLLPPLVMGTGAKSIPGEEYYFISPKGVVYSFNPALYPNGTILTTSTGSKGYLRVRVADRTRDVHTLVAVTFLDKDYVAKGLCCMHLDNDKTNPELTNLKLGTYSENNKAAYADGLNLGNGLKI